MADQGRWFKLWVSAPDDPDLGNLSLEDFARWCLLGIYLKVHGRDGSVTITFPARALCAHLRLPDFDAVEAFVARLKNVSVHVTEPGVTYRLTWKNWLKYQGDFSGDRVRAFRERNASEVTRKKRREETRREETRKTPSGPPSGGVRPEGFYHDENGFEPSDDDERESDEEGLEDARLLLAFLNKITGRTYAASSKTLHLIDARLREGWSVQDCKTMVARKEHDWHDDERMRTFLRPTTLFNRAKLESYMGELGFRASA